MVGIPRSWKRIAIPVPNTKVFNGLTDSFSVARVRRRITKGIAIFRPPVSLRRYGFADSISVNTGIVYLAG